MQANGPRPLQLERVGLAGRALRARRARANSRRASRRVVAQEVDGLAHVAQRVVQRLAGLAHHHRHQPHAVALVEVGGPVQDRARGPGRPAGPRPAPRRARSAMAASIAAASAMRTVPMRSRRSCGHNTSSPASRAGRRLCRRRWAPPRRSASARLAISRQQRPAHGRLAQRQAGAVDCARAQ